MRNKNWNVKGSLTESRYKHLVSREPQKRADYNIRIPECRVNVLGFSNCIGKVLHETYHIEPFEFNNFRKNLFPTVITSVPNSIYFGRIIVKKSKHSLELISKKVNDNLESENRFQEAISSLRSQEIFKEQNDFAKKVIRNSKFTY